MTDVAHEVYSDYAAGKFYPIYDQYLNIQEDQIDIRSLYKFEGSFNTVETIQQFK